MSVWSTLPFETGKTARLVSCWECVSFLPTTKSPNKGQMHPQSMMPIVVQGPKLLQGCSMQVEATTQRQQTRAKQVLRIRNT